MRLKKEQLEKMIEEEIDNFLFLKEAHHGVGHESKIGNVFVNGDGGTLTIVKGISFPSQGQPAETAEELILQIKNYLGIENQELEIKDGDRGKNITIAKTTKASKNTKSALLVITKNEKGENIGFIKYFNTPSAGMWTGADFGRFTGYIPQTKSGKKESYPIKPANLVPDERTRTIDELGGIVLQTASQFVKDGKMPKDGLVNIKMLFDAVMSGGESPILKNAAEYLKAYQDYFGEILAPCAVINNWLIEGQREESEKVLIKGIDKKLSYQNMKIKFSQSKNQRLIDSELIAGDENDPTIVIGISSKGGAKGADPSISGLYEIMQKGGFSAEIKKRHANVYKVLELISTKSIVEGPLQSAVLWKIITPQEYEYIVNLYDNPNSPAKSHMGYDKFNALIKSGKLSPLTPNLQSIMESIVPKNIKSTNYSVAYHLTAAIVKKFSTMANNSDKFDTAMKAIFSRSSFIQVYAFVQKVGKNDIKFDHFKVKYPPKIDGKIVITGQKSFYAGGYAESRLGFSIR